MIKPFVFGKIVDSTNFYNRKEEINELDRNIKNGFSVWLFSLRRCGKSSLIKQSFKNAPGTIKHG